jgi:hypothetical protein
MDKLILFNIKIQKTNQKKAIYYLANYDFSQPGYICLPDMSVVATAQKDMMLRTILNSTLKTFPEVLYRSLHLLHKNSVSGMYS